MKSKINLNEIIFILGQSKDWTIKNIDKLGYKTRDGKYYATIKTLEKYLTYSNELDLKEISLYKRLNKKRVNY